MTDMPDFKTITFGAWLAFWFDTYKRPYLKPYSLRNIEQMIRLHTPAWLKDMRVSQITVFDIDRALSEIPVSRTYIYTRQVWHNAFVKACRYGIAVQNPLDLCEHVRYTKKRGKALTIAEQEAFFKRLECSRAKWLMLFYIYTGVRRTEALTLEWQDVDESENLILIKGTKTADSYRHILLTDDVKAILDGQRKQTERERGTRYESKRPERVFDYSPCYISQAFKKLCPGHKLHDLRHTFITRCAESGVNVTVCQQLVGHSTPQLTLGIYTHVMDDFKRAEALKFCINPRFK